MAQAIGAPILLVVPMRMGCINHALLIAEAIANRGLTLVGGLANAGINPSYAGLAETIDTISHRINTFCLEALPTLAPEQSRADQLAIDRLLERLRVK